MVYTVSFEVYEEFGQKWVYIAHDGASGAKYVYNDKDELKDILHDYIDELVDIELEDEEEDN